ncbi:MAG: toll/interleukin-1 receptor domain-containing protein [Lentisphaerae bacterium]|nr:toll/interleukin-1 receptor domain-containing protein [Lentisphaerota bacterium]
MSKIVFISYARKNIETAVKLFNDLEANGIIPWLDIYELLPGQQWKPTIIQAIKKCDYFIALLSSNSVNHEGFVQKELKEALEILDECPNNDIYIIPVRLDNCVPIDERIKDLHRVDIFPDYGIGFKQILRVFEPEKREEKIIANQYDKTYYHTDNTENVIRNIIVITGIEGTVFLLNDYL